MNLSDRSRTNLEGVHPDLVRVVERAAELGGKFIVTEGLRTLDRQKQLLAAGKSKTLKSRHIRGFAVDMVAQKGEKGVSYAEADMKALASIVKQAAKDCGVPIEWGGDWKSFCDTPHWQLPSKQYPDKGPVVIKSVPPKEAPDYTPPPVPSEKPLGKSGTIWGAVAAFLAALVQYLESTFAAAMDVIAQLSAWEPVKASLMQVGGNAKSIGLGLGVSATVLVIARRTKAKVEGKTG